MMNSKCLLMAKVIDARPMVHLSGIIPSPSTFLHYESQSHEWKEEGKRPPSTSFSEHFFCLIFV